MGFIRKYAGRIIAALLAVILLQSAALLSVLAALDGQKMPQQETVGQTEEEMPAWLVAEQEEEAEEEPESVTEPEPEPEPVGLSAKDIFADAKVISHGMGKIEGVTTLNCLESFRLQYEKGVRVFEVDLRMTSDLQVVLRHDWRAGWQEGISETHIPTLAEFCSKPLLGKYTALSFRDLLLLMKEYPDVCIVTDSKFTDAETVTVQFEAMLRDARELGMDAVFDRIVVQVYSELMFKVVDSVGDFPHYIYTLYNTGFNQTVEAFGDVADFCSENGIDGITMWSYWWRETFAPIAQEHGLSVYVHTVNDVTAAMELIESGVSAIYTDEIVPADFEKTETEETADETAEETTENAAEGE